MQYFKLIYFEKKIDFRDILMFDFIFKFTLILSVVFKKQYNCFKNVHDKWFMFYTRNTIIPRTYLFYRRNNKCVMNKKLTKLTTYQKLI